MENPFQIKVRIHQLKDKVYIIQLVFLVPKYNIFNLLCFKVVGSPPKMQQIQTVSDVKRIRVAPPKPGHLYPNLFETENTTETETDTEYTVNSTEVETATLDEKTDTETGTEAEYYVQVRYFCRI